ncbi:hypothetical protein FHETE_1911 [Fusarium heterosporum]|uniref:Uncharacterized protein n=1 Tax=Fusarium heterosporum TaxID=42747 RepID=A0A8H5TXL7_FUSHE|nr:hypothetical protein FHETE_1911 [Fusarium heterosporum]
MSSHPDLAKTIQDVVFVSRHENQEHITDGVEVIGHQSDVLSGGVEGVLVASESDHGAESDPDKGVESWHLVGKAGIVEAVTSERSAQQINPKDLRFDDTGMASVHSSDFEEDSDSDSEDDAGGVKRSILFDYEVLMPSDLIYQTHSPTNYWENTERSFPGVWAVRESLSAAFRFAQTNIARSYNSVTGGIITTTQRTCDAVTATGQVGGYVAEGAFAAGQNVAVMIQESWPNLPRPFNRGILDTVTGYLLEGIQSLPPSDAIIRPQGRRMH